MLVLSRRQGERIVIDGSIVITITEIRGAKVRVGIEAPGLKINRGELEDDREEVSPVLPESG